MGSRLVKGGACVSAAVSKLPTASRTTILIPCGGAGKGRLLWGIQRLQRDEAESRAAMTEAAAAPVRVALTDHVWDVKRLLNSLGGHLTT